MDDNRKSDLKARTYKMSPASPSSYLSSQSSIKSDMQIHSRNTQSKSTSSFKTPNKMNWEYYKKYEHDEVPVKELSSSSYATGDSQRELPKLTDSLLDRIEQTVLDKCSEKPDRHNDDTHIKFFKTTVEKIFDAFYSSLRDIESFKKRYQDIIGKCSPKQTEKEMEIFIKDIIQEIKSTESLKTDEVADLKAPEAVVSAESVDEVADLKAPEAVVSTESESGGSVIEAYKNITYEKESSAEEITSTPTPRPEKHDEVLNIYFVNTTSAVEIRVTERQMQSEGNVNNTVAARVLSADNFKNKTLDVIGDVIIEQETQDREIPIKSGIPKRDLYLNEDFQCENDKSPKTLLQKICSYICKKIRKTSS